MSTPQTNSAQMSPRLGYRTPVQFMNNRISCLESWFQRELPPLRAGVDVVSPLLSLEVIFYNVTVPFLFNAFRQNIQNLQTMNSTNVKKKRLQSICVSTKINVSFFLTAFFHVSKFVVVTVDLKAVRKQVQTWRSLLSMASRCGWMRMGLRRSLTRDSAMREDSLYSSLASSCRRKWVDFLTLQWVEPWI